MKLGEWALLLGIGYAVYSYAYKQKSAQETQQDLMQATGALTSAISKAPEFYYETMREYFPGYKEWSDEWVQQQLDKNTNNPN